MKKIIPIIILLTLTFVGCSLTGTPDNNNSSNAYFSNPNPENNVSGQSVVVSLSWETSGFDYYDVYFSRYAPPTTLVANNLTTTSFLKSGLSYNTTYYWKVVGHSSDGSTKESPIWAFTTRNLNDPGEGLIFIDHGITTETPNFVKVLFQAVDNTGVGIDNLTIDELKVYDDSDVISQSESYLLLEQYLANQFVIKIVLVLDVSTSLRDEISNIKTEAIDFVNSVADSYHEIAVLDFSETTILVQDFTSDIPTLEAAINSIAVGAPTTDLYGATMVGAEKWEDSFDPAIGIETGALVLFTDGTDTQGSHTLDQALDATYGKRVYTIGLGNEISPPILEQIGRSGFFSITETIELSNVFDQITLDLEKYSKSFYWLTYASPKRGTNLHTFTVRGLESTDNSYVEGTYSSADFFTGNAGLHVNATAINPDGIDEISIAKFTTKNLEAYSFYYENPQYTWTITSGNSLISLSTSGSSNYLATVSADTTLGDAIIQVQDITNSLTKNITVHITN